MSKFSKSFSARSESIGDNVSTEFENDFDNRNYVPRQNRSHHAFRINGLLSSLPVKMMLCIILHLLDSILTMILTPFTAYRWLSQNETILTMLRVILEVLLELSMWFILGGVSILTAFLLTLNDMSKKKEKDDEHDSLSKTIDEHESIKDKNQNSKQPVKHIFKRMPIVR